jgi:hypothetical protein
VNNLPKPPNITVPPDPDRENFCMRNLVQFTAIYLGNFVAQFGVLPGIWSCFPAAGRLDRRVRLLAEHIPARRSSPVKPSGLISFD